MKYKIDKKLKAYRNEISARGLSYDLCGELIENARDYYNEYMKDDIPPGEMMHAEGIYLISAMYKALLPKLGKDSSYEVVSKVLYERCAKMGRWCDRITRIPGFKYLFIILFEKMTDKLFDEASDFNKDILVRDSKEFSFNMKKCPYVKYFKRAGFPELCSISCIADEYSYGHMRNILFERTQTLGTGGECCDFSFKVK